MYMAKTAACGTSWIRWSAKKYILAALLGTLAMLAVAAGISISLAPAHISFSITSGVLTNATSNNINRHYNFTVVATNNISSRPAVQYGSLSAQIWYSNTGWVPAEGANNMTGAATVCQQPGNANDFNISAPYLEFNELGAANSSGGQLDTGMDSSGINITWPECKVVVEAKVWFRFRLVTTRQYTIRAACYPVDFVHGVTAPVNCTL